MKWYASWLNYQWLQIRLNSGYKAMWTRFKEGRAHRWQDHVLVRQCLEVSMRTLRAFLDVSLTHTVEDVVVEDVEGYLQAMEAYEFTEQASWFRGQQINLNLNGQIDSMWSTREAHREEFGEL